jgi:hypothetical protein
LGAARAFSETPEGHLDQAWQRDLNRLSQQRQQIMPDVTTTAPNSDAEIGTAASSTFTAFVLAQLRCTQLKAEIVVNQIEAATVALNAKIITPEVALLLMHEAGLPLVEVSS